MKKIYALLVYLSLILNAGPVIGFNSTKPDSVNTISSSLSDTNSPKIIPGSYVSNRIAVKAGDSITITAVLLDNRSNKGHFWKSLGKAIVPSLLINRLTKSPTPNSVSEITPSDATTFGASLTVIPASIELLQKKYKAKTLIGLVAYDSDNKEVGTLTDFMTKAAQKDWEKLRIDYRVEQDGFVEIIGSKDEGLSFVDFGHSKWLQVSKYSHSELSKAINSNPITTSVESTSSDPSARAGAPINTMPASDKPQTMGTGQTCTAWYWCDGWGCTFVGISCQDQIDYGEDNNGGGGGTYLTEEQACAECKQKAQNEHDANLTAAKTALFLSVTAGCSYAGATTYISFNTAGWWVNLVPGIGPAAIQALSVIGGLAVDITCLVTAVQTYNAAEATIENNYYKDMRDCREKFKNCN